MSCCMVRATNIESHQISAVSSCLLELLTPEEDFSFIKATIILQLFLIFNRSGCFEAGIYKVECQQSGVHVYLTILSTTHRFDLPWLRDRGKLNILMVHSIDCIPGKNTPTFMRNVFNRRVLDQWDTTFCILSWNESKSKWFLEPIPCILPQDTVNQTRPTENA